MNAPKLYLGDGVYVQLAESRLILTTENGLSTTNRIVLEPEVQIALIQYIERLVEGRP